MARPRISLMTAGALTATACMVLTTAAPPPRRAWPPERTIRPVPYVSMSRTRRLSALPEALF